MKDVYDYLESKLKDSTVVIGVSGGPDSMVLLHILNNIKDMINLKIVVCSVNHNTGRDGQKEEYNYVEEYSKNNGLILLIQDFEQVFLKNAFSSPHK